MSDTPVTERRVRPIQDALTAGNLKQALKECEKWQKKGENSDRFLALKAAVLTQQTDLKQQEKGKVETLQLCRRDPAVVNVEALYQLQNTLRHLSLEIEEAPKLWERAVATRPNDKDLIQTWLTGSISAGNWQSAQKATMSLRKAFPKERQYEFWNILMCYLIHRDPKVPEKERTLFGTLANRLVSKAGQTPSGDKGLSNPEELSLWAAILTSTGNGAEVAQVLQSKQLQPVTEQDPQHAFTLLLEALRQPQDVDEIIKFCDKALFSADQDQSKLDDDRVWMLRCYAAQSPELREILLHKVDKFVAEHTQYRAASLARLDLLSHDKQKADELYQGCKFYYDRYGTKAFSFDDLIGRLIVLGLDRMGVFLEEILSTATEPTQQIFALKLEYHIISSNELNVAVMYQFAAKALDLHEKMPGNTTSCPEAALLAALALALTAVKTQEQKHALQACMILHTCTSKYPEYYPLCVLLLQLQRILALISLSMANFYRLSVKNLQWETLGHLLLTRISSIHPWKSDLEPLGFLDAALHVFESADRSLDRSINEGLQNGSYGNVIETVTVRRNLQYSLCRQLFAIEERKTQRVCGVPVTFTLDVQGGDLVDLRDTSFMPAYGTDMSSLQRYLQCGPPPTQSWVHVMARTDHLLTFLSSELAGHTSQAAEALTALEKEMAYNTVNYDGMTATEQQTSSVVEKLCHAIHLQFKESKGQQTDFDSLLQDVQKWLEQTCEQAPTFSVASLDLPAWDFLHLNFVILETLQLVALFLGVQSKKAKSSKGKAIVIIKENVSDLQNLISMAEKAAHERAAKLKAGLNDPGVLSKLVDTILGRMDEDPSQAYKEFTERLERLQDEIAVEEFCGAMKNSWEDALDGILAVKVKFYK